MSEEMMETGEAEVSFNDEQLSPALNRLIGEGMDFKRVFLPTRDGVAKNTGIKRINQSINDILSTRIGERGFMRSYGSDLHKLLFSPNDEVLHDLIRIYIQDAIQKWEKRIRLEEVEIESNPEQIDRHVVYVRINYTIRNSNVRGSYVYPFVQHPLQIGGVTENDKPYY